MMHYKIEEGIRSRSARCSPSLPLSLPLSPLCSSPNPITRPPESILPVSQCKIVNAAVAHLSCAIVLCLSPLLCSAPIQIPSVFHRTVLSFPRKITGGISEQIMDAAKDESGFSLWRPLCFRATRSLAGWPSKIAISERFDLRATRGDRANTALCQVV